MAKVIKLEDGAMSRWFNLFEDGGKLVEITEDCPPRGDLPPRLFLYFMWKEDSSGRYLFVQVIQSSQNPVAGEEGFRGGGSVFPMRILGMETDLMGRIANVVGVSLPKLLSLIETNAPPDDEVVAGEIINIKGSF